MYVNRTVAERCRVVQNEYVDSKTFSYAPQGYFGGRYDVKQLVWGHRDCGVQLSRLQHGVCKERFIYKADSGKM